MTAGFGKKPGQQRDLHWKSTFWMAAAFVVALAVSSAQAVAATFGYVTNANDGTVSVINPANNTSVATISVGNDPTSLAVTPDGAHVYVLNAQDSTVSVIAAATNTVVGSPIPVGPTRNYAGGIAISPSGSSVYVVNNGSNSVSVIATATNTVVGSPIPVGSSPSGIAITPDGAHAYVANILDGTVSVIATASNTVVDTFPVGTSSSHTSLPVGVAITPDGSRVYIANLEQSEVEVIATATNTAIAAIPVSSGACNSGPLGIAITPDGTHAYVLHASTGQPPDCPSSPGAAEESVLVIDTATDTLVGSPITVGTGGFLYSYTIGMTPDGTAVYVPVPATTSANVFTDTLAVISTAGNTQTATVTVGHAPLGVAFAPALPFSKFTATLAITPAAFTLDGAFALPMGAPALNPVTQSVTLTVGTYTVTLPVGSFRAGPTGVLTYVGVVNKVGLAIVLTPAGTGAYNIAVEALGVDVANLSHPVKVTLTVGDDIGTTDATTL